MADELLNTFLDESEEHLESINNLFLELEESEFEDEEALDQVLRELHSLKGSAQMVGVESIEQVIHATETIIKNIRSGDEEFTGHMMDMFFEVVDDVQTAVDEMVEQQEFVETSHLDLLMDKLDLFLMEVEEEGEEAEPEEDNGTYTREELMELDYNDIQALAMDLGIKANQSHEDLAEEILEQTGGEAEAQEDEEKSEEAGEKDEEEEQKETSQTSEPEDYAYEVWDPSEFEDMVEDYLAEAQEMLNQLTNSLIELEEEQSLEKVDAIFRVAHTLKGSSGMIGLEVLEDLAHDMEELLDEVREGEREVTAELVDLLLLCNDKIEEILDLVENLEPVQVRTRHLLEGIEQFREEGTVDLEAIREAEENLDEPETEEVKEDSETEVSEDEKAQKQKDTSKKKSKSKGKVSESIRVNIEKLDDVINLVGELVINRSRMEQKMDELQDLSQELENLEDVLTSQSKSDEEKLDYVSSEIKLLRRAFEDTSTEVDQSSDDISRVVSELQESVMRTRMVPVAQLFNKFPRLVRDVSRETGKEVNLELEGKDTEMDKTVIEKIGDPLMHIIRNSVDHGIETPEERREAGKDEEGTLSISAGYEGDLVVIEIEDDGQGIQVDAVKETALDRGVVSEEELEEMSTDEIQQLIFEPGFSTKEEVSETSGRGVGMDVVRSNIRELNGTVDMESVEGEGSTFTIKLPLTVAIIQVLQVRIGERRFALPLSSVQETLRIREEEIRQVGQQEVFELRGQTLSLLRLEDVLGYSSGNRMGQDIYPVVVIQSGNQWLGLLVEELIQKQEIVIKDLGTLLDDVKFASGATILGDGSVVLIVDIGEIVDQSDELESSTSVTSRSKESSPTTSDDRESTSEKGGGGRDKILVVEDTATQRQVIQSALEEAGYETEPAEDGREALEKASEEQFDLVTMDIKMPFMDGYEATQELRDLDQYRSVPIVLISSMDEKIDKMRGFDAGADDYLDKPFSEEEIRQKVKDLLREVG